MVQFKYFIFIALTLPYVFAQINLPTTQPTPSVGGFVEATGAVGNAPLSVAKQVTSAVGAAPSAIRSALSSAGVTLPTGASASHPVSSAATLKASATATGIHSGANYSSQANLFQGFIVALVSVGFYFQAYV